MSTITQDNLIAPQVGERTIVQLPSLVVGMVRHETFVLLALSFLSCSVRIELNQPGILAALPAISESMAKREVIEFSIIQDTEEVVGITVGGQSYEK